jgi:ribosomal protein S18 acetylase RimI-like enzyme
LSKNGISTHQKKYIPMKKRIHPETARNGKSTETAGWYVHYKAAAHVPPPWSQPLHEFTGSSPRVDAFARNWNEEAFFTNPMNPAEVSEPIHVGRSRLMGGFVAGRPAGTKGVLAHYEYGIAKDRTLNRWLLMQRTVADDTDESDDWAPVGEYHNGNLGVAEAYRQDGAGTAFVRELIQRGVWKPSIGYSPEGLRTVQKAHRQIIEQALQEGKPVPLAVLQIYPSLTRPADVGTRMSEESSIPSGYRKLD